MVSASDTFTAPQNVFGSGSFDSDPFNGPQRPRYDSSPLLQLPAPLGRAPAPGSPVSGLSQPRSSEEAAPYMHGHDSSHQRLLPSPSGPEYQQEYSPDIYEQQQSPSSGHPSSIESHMNRIGATGVLRQSTTSTQYPVETQNPYRHSQPQAAMGYDESYAYSTEPEEMPHGTASPIGNRNNRGFSLADNGPVPGPEGVRRIARQQGRRPSSQVPPANANRYSRSSVSTPSPNPGQSSLPPGAAAPNPYQYR
jgi:chitin synthase